MTARGIRTLRVLYRVLSDLVDGQLTLRAMSLVYTTLLSLVPLLAVSFSVLKGFGVHNQIEPILLNVLTPLGERGVEITRQIIEFVENVKVGVLGSVGLGLLLFTVVSLTQKIERAFNYTWRVTEHRSFAQRFSDYISVILIGPLLIFSAIGITASISSTAIVQSLLAIEPFGTLIHLAGKILPYILVIAAFTFFYILVPNTKVRFRSALMGGAVAGVLWETVGWAFASFIAAATNYTAIYSGFAILVMFMIWLYLAWLMLLVGASMAFYHQHPEYLVLGREGLRMSNRVKERVALLVMATVAKHFYQNQPGSTLEQLARHVSVPREAMATVLGEIENAGFLKRTAEEPPTYLPARALETIPIKELLEEIRAAGESATFSEKRLNGDPDIDELLRCIDGAVEDVLEGYTIRDLAVRSIPDASLAKETSDRKIIRAS